MPEFTPPGWHTITTRLIAGDPEGLVTFLKRVFDASGEYKSDRPAEITIGDSIVMISGAGPRETTNALLYVYVADADGTYRRAVDAGATTIEAPLDTPYGDRRAMVADPFGNTWQIATYRPQGSAQH